jgi:hypothetical protein
VKHWNASFVIFLAVIIISVTSYFFGMYSAGSTVLSGNSQDWGAFGSFLSGILFPASALFGGYHVYRTFQFSAYNQKLVLIRDSLTRLDEELTKKLSMPFNNNCFGGDYFGQKLKDVIIALSNKKLETVPEVNQAILSLLHNVAIYCESFHYYIVLLDKYPTEPDDTDWLGNLERHYWLERYSTICGRMVDIVGVDAFKNECTEKQFESYNFIFTHK